MINTGKAFEEDLFSEMRIHHCLLRSVGPCVRCGFVKMDWQNLKKHDQEPKATLSKFRNIPGLGDIFGMLYQMEILDMEAY